MLPNLLNFVQMEFCEKNVKMDSRYTLAGMTKEEAGF